MSSTARTSRRTAIRRLGGTVGGKQPTGPDGHWLEPLTVLSVVAGQTSRIRLGTNILLAALRTPAVLAKTMATLDVLSGGRIDLGVGVGWQREEYEACGLDFSQRGKLLDRTLEVCQLLWREQVATFDDGDLRFERIHMMPKPVQDGGVPIWVSGTVNTATARRLARFGSAWIPWGADAQRLPETIPQMREAVVAAGGSGAFDVVATIAAVRNGDGELDPEATMAPVPSLIAVGVTDCRLFVPIPAGVEAGIDALSPVGRRVPRRHRLTASGRSPTAGRSATVG